MSYMLFGISEPSTVCWSCFVFTSIPSFSGRRTVSHDIEAMGMFSLIDDGKMTESTRLEQ